MKASRSIGWTVLAIFGIVILLGDFIAPYDHTSQLRADPSAPPSVIRFYDQAGEFHLRPFIYRQKLADPLSRTYGELTSTRYQLTFLPSGDRYYFLGIFSAQTHLFGVEATDESPRIHVFGTDELGRDRFSRLLRAIRFSLLVCPIGALLAWVVGFAIGLISGSSGARTDSMLMGIADTMLALPSLVLILAARAAFPLELPPMRAATLLVLIFAAVGWAETARLTRGLVRSIRQQEYILAARAIGLSDARVMLSHILPNALPTILRQGLVTLPVYLLAEVALSFLGVGLQEPNPSLGTLLAAAADVNQLQRDPLIILAPGIVITVFVLAIRIVGGSAEGPRKFNS
jgi:peptide/nickel transport system permease protein